MSQPSPLEPTILGAIFRRWRLVAVFVMLAVALSLLYLATTDPKYQSTATVVLEDPRSSITSQGSFNGFDQEAYVAQQRNLAESRRVEALTVRDLRQEFPDRSFVRKDVAENIVIDAPLGDAKLDLNFIDIDPEVAEFGATTLLAHFKDTRDLDNNDKLSILRDSSDELVAERLALIEERNDVEGVLSDLRASLGVNTRETASQIEDARQDEVDQLEKLAEKADINDRITAINLELREVNALTKANELPDRGIALEVAASETPAERLGSGAASIITLAVVLGSLLGTAVAYLLSVRRREFADKAQPEVVLGAPLITEIANPAHEKLRRLQFPVVDAPSSAVAEGYRFVAAAVATDLTADDALRGSVGVAASTTSANSNLAVANIGLALASQGLDVLLVDADVRRGELTEVLCADQAWDLDGLTDVLTGSVTADRALRSVMLDSGHRLDLLSAGTLAGPTAPACRPDTLRAMLTQLEDRFDVVLVNVPALLHSADSASVLGAVGSVVLLVDHGSSVDTLLDSAERIEVAHTNLLGYVYTNAPLSRGLAGYVKANGGGRSGKGSRSGRGLGSLSNRTSKASTNGSSPSDLIEAGAEAS